MKKQTLSLFYKKGRLASLHANALQHSIVSANDWAICEIPNNGPARILATDVQDSTIAFSFGGMSSISYAPYGHASTERAVDLLSRFNGQAWLPLAIGYFLGNGHRTYNPGSMRFNSADSLSPFAEGGINAYAYCGNDPVNRSDPGGKSFIKKLMGGYSYKKLRPKLNDASRDFSSNEYSALGLSINKRIEKANSLYDKLLLSATPGITTAITRKLENLDKQQLAWVNLKPSENGTGKMRYGARRVLGEMIAGLPNGLDNPAMYLPRAASFSEPSTSRNSVSSRQIEEELDGLLARLMALRGDVS